MTYIAPLAVTVTVTPLPPPFHSKISFTISRSFSRGRLANFDHQHRSQRGKPRRGHHTCQPHGGPRGGRRTREEAEPQGLHPFPVPVTRFGRCWEPPSRRGPASQVQRTRTPDSALEGPARPLGPVPEWVLRPGLEGTQGTGHGPGPGDRRVRRGAVGRPGVPLFEYVRPTVSDR